MQNDQEFVWAIAYINRKKLKHVEHDLHKYDYDEIEVYIPTVKILKKQFKGQQEYEFQPLLFNYGFFKIPYKMACIPEYLMTLRYRIECIYGWVKDPTSEIQEIPSLKTGNDDDHQALHKDQFLGDEDLSDIFINTPQCALAKDSEIDHLKKSENLLSVYTKDELDILKKGDYIILKTYPWEGIRAKIISISHKKKEVKVELDMDTAMKKVTVSFDNVFYTVYNNHDINKPVKEESLEEIKDRSKSNSIDRIIYKTQY